MINQLRTRELELSALYETTLKRLIESESNLNEMKGRVTALAEEKAKSESSFGTKIRELQEKISNFEQTAEVNDWDYFLLFKVYSFVRSIILNVSKTNLNKTWVTIYRKTSC